MCTGRAEVRKRKECCEISEVLTLGTIIVICGVILGFGALLYTTVHQTNSCAMTYMYRKLQFMVSLFGCFLCVVGFKHNYWYL